MRPPKGTPTRLNLWVLWQRFGGCRVAIPNLMPATDAPHMRRCARAGLLAVDPDGMLLRLTPAGEEALRNR